MTNFTDLSVKDKFKAVKLMEDNGSGFESRLASLWFHADHSNMIKLEAGFSDLFNKWSDQFWATQAIKALKVGSIGSASYGIIS